MLKDRQIRMANILYKCLSTIINNIYYGKLIVVKYLIKDYP